VQGYFEAEAGGNPYSCVTLSGDALAAPSASFMTLDSLIPPGALTGMQRVEPNEIIGGIESRHYRAENVAAGEFTSATVDVWVAREGGYVTRMEITGQGTFADMGTGEMRAAYSLVSANQPVDIIPPSVCTADRH
jgi:hypothetical protein